MGGYQEVFSLPAGEIPFVSPSHVGGKNHKLLHCLRILGSCIFIPVAVMPVYISSQILSLGVFFRQVLSLGNKAVRIQQIGLIQLVIEGNSCPEGSCHTVQIHIIDIRNQLVCFHVLHIQPALHIGITLCQTSDEKIGVQVAVVIGAECIDRESVLCLRIDFLHFLQRFHVIIIIFDFRTADFLVQIPAHRISVI